MAILAFLTKIFLRLLGLLVSAVLVWTVPPQFATTIESKEADALLQFTVLSDIHMESYEYVKFQGFAKALRDAAGADQKDALVFLGDNTENGQNTEYLMFYSLLAHYGSAQNTLVAMGNHDLNQSAWETQQAIDRHNFFYEAHTGKAYDKPYYAQKINGCTFIVLGDEDPQEDTTAFISAAQLSFLDAELSAAPAGKPIFVFLHQPLNHFTPTRFKVGAQSDQLQDLFEAHDNVFVFSGHVHASLSSANYKELNGVHYINVPKLFDTNSGWQVEAYAGKVLLRARDYINGAWLPTYEFSIPLV